jgi:hypothetical protein
VSGKTSPDQVIEAKVDVGGGPWLSGWPRVVMQLGAAGVVCMLLVYSQFSTYELIRELREDQRDEVAQFREELRVQREADRESRSRQWQIIKDNSEMVREAIRELRKKE